MKPILPSAMFTMSVTYLLYTALLTSLAPQLCATQSEGNKIYAINRWDKDKGMIPLNCYGSCTEESLQKTFQGQSTDFYADFSGYDKIIFPTRKSTIASILKDRYHLSLAVLQSNNSPIVVPEGEICRFHRLKEKYFPHSHISTHSSEDEEEESEDDHEELIAKINENKLKKKRSDEDASLSSSEEDNPKLDFYKNYYSGQSVQHHSAETPSEYFLKLFTPQSYENAQIAPTNPANTLIEDHIPLKYTSRLAIIPVGIVLSGYLIIQRSSTEEKRSKYSDEAEEKLKN